MGTITLIGKCRSVHLAGEADAQHAAELRKVGVFTNLIHRPVRVAYAPERRNVGGRGVALGFCDLLLPANNFERVCCLLLKSI